MQKYITAAALLAAGTMLADAATPVFSTTGTPSASYDVSGLTTSSAFSFTFTADLKTFASMLGNTAEASQANTPTLVSVSDGSHNFGTAIGYSSAGTSSIQRIGVFGVSAQASTGTYAESYEKTSSASGAASTGTGNLLGQTTDAGNHIYALSDVAGLAVTYAYSYVRDTSSPSSHFYATIQLKNGTYVDVEGSHSTSFKWGDSGAPQTINVNTDAGVSSVSLYGECLSSSDAFAANKAAISAIPEPSAFGLIAGVGALALVASRRRRRAK